MSLTKLIEAVEAGTARPGKYGHPDVMFMEVWLPTVSGPQLWQYASEAYDGSLDAAKRLHDALLPGWVVRLTAGTDQSSFPYVHVFKPRKTEDDPAMGANSSGYRGYDPARAWLLAILRALEEEGRDG